MRNAYNVHTYVTFINIDQKQVKGSTGLRMKDLGSHIDLKQNV